MAVELNHGFGGCQGWLGSFFRGGWLFLGVVILLIGWICCFLRADFGDLAKRGGAFGDGGAELMERADEIVDLGYEFIWGRDEGLWGRHEFMRREDEGVGRGDERVGRGDEGMGRGDEGGCGEDEVMHEGGEFEAEVDERV